jgi:hypothetical protein
MREWGDNLLLLSSYGYSLPAYFLHCFRSFLDAVCLKRRGQWGSAVSLSSFPVFKEKMAGDGGAGKDDGLLRFEWNG